MTKYADDTSLLVPEINTVSLEEEFDHLQVWAQTNKLGINMLKTKKIIFHRPNPRGLVVPPPLTNIECVKFTKLLARPELPVPHYICMYRLLPTTHPITV